MALSEEVSNDEIASEKEWKRDREIERNSGSKVSFSLAVVVVKWSACSPSTPTIRVRIPLTPTVFL